MVTRPDSGGDAFDAALRRRLGGDALESTPDCLDADQLAAYYERTLDRDARERCDAHLADCARCQAALAGLARADTGGSARQRWWAPAWSLDWRIAAPALAAVLVLAVAVARMRGHVTVAAPEQLVSARLAEMRLQQAARARESARPEPAAPATVSELAMNEAARAQRGGAGGGEAATESAPVAAPAAKAESRAARPQRKAAMAKERATVREMIASTSGAAAPPPTVNSAAVAQAAPVMPNAPVEAPSGGTPQALAPATGGGATAGEGAAAIAPAPGAAVGGMARFAVVSPQFIVRAPDGVARWHVRAGDQVDYTPNGLDFYGSATGVAAPLTAGSAPAVNVCWMVGRAGAVIRTTDGTHWTRLSSPTGADLTGIKANDADNATVTDLNGRHFTTTDGGRSWSPR